MQLQGRTLSLDMRGADVRLLQLEIRLLDLDLPDEEVDANHFGEGTQGAVLQFQEEFGLDPTGLVERVTARRINAAVRQEHIQQRRNPVTL